MKACTHLSEARVEVTRQVSLLSCTCMVCTLMRRTQCCWTCVPCTLLMLPWCRGHLTLKGH